MGLPGDTVHTALDEEEIQRLRALYWDHDRILHFLKTHGVNDNWDMVHAHIVATLIVMGKNGRRCQIRRYQLRLTVLRTYVI